MPQYKWYSRKKGIGSSIEHWKGSNFVLHGILTYCGQKAKRRNTAVWFFSGFLTPYLIHCFLTESRVMENINGCIKLVNKYEQVDAHIVGSLQEWRTNTTNVNGGKLLVKVFSDIRQQKWHVKLKGNNLYAPVKLIFWLLVVFFFWKVNFMREFCLSFSF